MTRALSHGKPRSRDLVTLGVQGAIIDEEKRVLLIRHSYRPGWHFPGGGVEHGETLTTALGRELLEETGVRLTAMPRLFGLYSHFDKFPGDHIALFVITEWHQMHVPPPNSEIAEQRLFDIDALPGDLSNGARRRINEMFRGVARTDAW